MCGNNDGRLVETIQFLYFDPRTLQNRNPIAGGTQTKQAKA